jgi:phage terminase large subunit-like protein
MARPTSESSRPSLLASIARQRLETIEANTTLSAEEGRLDPAAWAEKYFYVPETDDHRLVLDPYQKQALREALSVDERGLFRYSTIVWSDIKKSIKSTIAGALILWWADTHEWASIKIVANDLKQADSREAFYARRAIELNKDYFIGQRHVKVTPSGYTIEFPLTHSRVEAIPIDPGGEAGGNDDLVVYTELWAARNTAAQRMWTETTLSPTKFGRSLRWVETYAGFDGESPILQNLYRQGVENGERLDPDLEMFANHAARLFCLWNTVPRLAWQTPEYYAQEAATLTENEFDRVHRNRWVSSVSIAIPSPWWEACRDPMPLVPGDRTPLVIAVDASTKHDCTGLVVVSRHPKESTHVCERHCQAWYPSPALPMDYTRTLTPAIRELCKNYNVVQICYDPYQLHQWATDLRNEGLAWLREFPQGEDRLKADKGLVDLVRERRLHHRGDAELGQHIGNCNAKAAPEQDNKLRLIKKAEDRKIDLAVCLSMAASECLRLNV